MEQGDISDYSRSIFTTVNMSELKDLVAVMQQQLQFQKQQMQEQKEQMQEQIKEQREQFERQLELQKAQQQEQMLRIIDKMGSGGTVNVTDPTINVSTFHKFEPFDCSSELWTAYYKRFLTHVEAQSISGAKRATIFLTSQTSTVYELLDTWATQQKPSKSINDLTMDEIVTFMGTQFDPKKFLIKERHYFWRHIVRQPGETIRELGARIRKKAATCAFNTIKDPLDEALRTCFVCCVNNEKVVRALYKVKEDELDFQKAMEMAEQIEETDQCAKETVGTKPKPVHKVNQKSRSNNKSGKFHNSEKYTCYRCGKPDHKANECPCKDKVCNHCNIKGHLKNVCRKRDSKPETKNVHRIRPINAVTRSQESAPKLEVPLDIDSKTCIMEVDTATGSSFLSKEYWEDIGCPKLTSTKNDYASASQHTMPILGAFIGKVKTPGSKEQHDIEFVVSEVPDLNLLGREATKKIGLSVDKLMYASESCNAVFSNLKTDKVLQDKCRALCDEFSDLWKPELGCLKDFELDVKFKKDAQPVFCKPRSVALALQEDLDKAYEQGIAKGVWEPTHFNEYGTPVVPVKKALLPEQTKAKLRVCGDYSVTVNSQLEDHRHPLPLPEDLMRKLGGGYGFSKVDMADAYNQIMLNSRSQKRLALSTHRGVLLQKRLPFGIKSAPGYFQQIMDQLTKDLPGVAVYLDDILVSGKDREDHVSNLRGLLQRLDEKGLRCRLEKCQFASPYVEYLGHLLSHEGIAKGPKVDAVLKMKPPTDVSSLRAFLGSVQFYAKFLPTNLATISSPLYRLTKKNTPWKWGDEEQKAFNKLKDLLSSENVLVHFNVMTPIGMACDASSTGIGAVLFHRYSDGTERPIANVSKILTDTQRNYSQVQKEALAIIFGLKKFYQYLYGRKFVLVTDHRPLLALFGPGKATPALAANRLARWALLLSQFNYRIEYRKTNHHSNADALSRLPADNDPQFDREESEEDAELVCAIQEVCKKVNPGDQNILKQESAKDPVISMIQRFVREGWPPRKSDEGSEVTRYRQLADSLSLCNGCLLLGSRVVIPASMRKEVLEQLHLGHFGMQRMKQLARTAVYWPNIDDHIEGMCRQCISCGEHQNKPAKPAIHPWMLPEKPWSRVHLDHAINFLGSNWLVLIDAYSKYPCIHPTQSVSTKSTIDLLEQDFAHFGYPHTLVTDNATTFMSEEFQHWCKERGITHLTGAPYHPATNGAAERLVQTFKQALRKSSLPPRKALQEFLMQYRRTPNSSGYSPSEMLNSRQIRTKIDTLLPSPAHTAQGRQAREATKSQKNETVAKVNRHYNVGDAVYALYFGPRRDKEPRWVPAVVVKRKGTRTVNVRVYPRGPTWRRHVEQLQPRHVSDDDDYEPGDETPVNTGDVDNESMDNPEVHELPPIETVPYGNNNPRRSTRARRPPDRYTPQR